MLLVYIYEETFILIIWLVASEPKKSSFSKLLTEVGKKKKNSSSSQFCSSIKFCKPLWVVLLLWLTIFFSGFCCLLQNLAKCPCSPDLKHFIGEFLVCSWIVFMSLQYFDIRPVFWQLKRFFSLVKNTLYVFVFTFPLSKFIRSRLISSLDFSSLLYCMSVAKVSYSFGSLFNIVETTFFNDFFTHKCYVLLHIICSGEMTYYTFTWCLFRAR